MRFAALLSLSCLATCGDDAAGGPADASESDTPEVSDAGETVDSADPGDTLIRPEADVPEVVEPIDAPAGVWTWVDQPGSACSDGSETGFAVNRGTSDDVLLLFMGGGGCWSFDTCFLLATAVTGPFTRTQFEAAAPLIALGVLDRADADNPYRTWTQVFVPYCTGDLHAGDRTVDYTSGGLTRTWHHRGALNVRLMLPRLAATFPQPDRLVVAGFSAGGYGATLQYAAVRAALAPAMSQLVDDSGPLLIADAIPAEHRSAWFINWRLDALVDPICGQACKGDLSLFHAELAERFPEDRMALVSSLQDETIAAYFLMDGPSMEVAVNALAAQLATLPTWRTFLIAGDSHTTLGKPGEFVTQGIDLRTWLGLMVSGDAGWESVAP